jgi:hypothetical protein
MKSPIVFILLLTLSFFSIGQDVNSRKFYGTINKPRAYMFDSPLFGNKSVLLQNEKVELIEIVDGKIKVFIYNKYGYLFPDDLKQNAEFFEFKSKEEKRIAAIVKEKQMRLEEKARIDNDLLAKFDSIKQSFGDSSMFIIRSKRDNIQLFVSPNGKVLSDSLSRPDALKVIKIDNNEYLKIQSIYNNEIIGYILNADVEIDSKLQSEINRRSEERERSYQEFIKEKKRIEQEQLTKERKAELEQRRKILTAKYGSTIANRLINSEIWIGMTIDLAVESLGSPDSINETVSARGKDHQFVYTNLYLYFHDGVLTTYQKRY